MLFGYAGMLFHRKMRHYKEYKRPWKTSFFLIICKACYFLSNGIKWEYHINNILKKYFFKKEYLIEAHYYVKGLFNLHVPDCVKPSSIPKFGLCSEETGSTNKKNSTYRPSPRHLLSGDTKGSASAYTIWAYFGNNQRVSSSVFQRSPIIIVVGLCVKTWVRNKICPKIKGLFTILL